MPITLSEGLVNILSANRGTATIAVKKDNITAVQFHPEKSGIFGLKILEDWINVD